MLLRGGRRLHVLVRLDLAAAHRDLFGVRAGERHRGALRLDLPLQRLELGLRRLERRPRLVELLRRRHALLRQLLHAARW